MAVWEEILGRIIGSLVVGCWLLVSASPPSHITLFVSKLRYRSKTLLVLLNQCQTSALFSTTIHRPRRLRAQRSPSLLLLSLRIRSRLPRPSTHILLSIHPRCLGPPPTLPRTNTRRGVLKEPLRSLRMENLAVQVVPTS